MTADETRFPIPDETGHCLIMFADEATLTAIRDRLDHAARRWGIALPGVLVDFFACPRISPDIDPDEVADGEFFAFFERPDLELFLSMEELFPAYPLRCLPILQAGDGDALALFVPRGALRPVVVRYLHEETCVAWLTGDIAAVLLDPDRWSGHSERPMPAAGPVDHRLLIDAERDDPLEALAKPLALNRPFTGDDDAAQAAREALIGGLHRLHGQPLAALFQRHLQHGRDLLLRRSWQGIGRDLFRHGQPRAAIDAWENVVTLGQLYPDYGEPEPLADDPDWRKTRLDLEELLPLVAAHGDRFDQATLDRCLAVVRGYLERG